MRALFIAAALLLNSLTYTKAEALLTFDLFHLVYFSPTILTAKLIAEPPNLIDANYSGSILRRFLVQKVLCSDTIVLSDTIDVMIDSYHDYCPWCIAPHFDTFILFGGYGKPDEAYAGHILYLTMSGLRAFRNDTAFVPYQYDLFYTFLATPNSSFSETVARIERTITRIDSVLTLRNIQPREASNAAILKWIEQHLGTLKADIKGDWGPNPQAHESWGQLGMDVFSWINGNGIWQDTWKAMLISKEIWRPKLDYFMPSSNSFKNAEARAFLMLQIASSPEDLLVAVSILNECLWDWPSNENSISPEEQSTIMRIAMLLLEEESLLIISLYEVQSLRIPILQLVANAAFPPSELGNRPDFSLLPDLKRLFERTQPGDFRLQLGQVIQRMERQ